MSRSYEDINYSIRPAKNIERKMLAETLQRLTYIDHVDQYRYIGFGSTYFSDFSLFHRLLGICNMISVEKDEDNQERFKFNAPFACIDLKFGTSNDVLPELDWSVKTIMWLDYDDELDVSVLADVQTACTNLQAGSVLILSVNAHPKSIRDVVSRLSYLQGKVGMENIPIDVAENQLSGWGTAQVARRIIDNKITSTLNARNGGRDVSQEIYYKQLFNFHYADNAKMLTLGGVLYDAHQSEDLDKCSFDAIQHVRTGDEFYHIEVPNLTYKEVRHIDRHLPSNDYKTIVTAAVPQDDVRKYSKIYRYYPNFAEAEI